MTHPTSDTMDEATFRTVSSVVIERVRTALDAQDPDVVEANIEADVLKISFPSGAPFVLNMQRPIKEMWLAADRNAWHFKLNADGAWRDKKNGDELYATLARLVHDRAHVSVSF
jgi:CyaY protein